MSSHRIDLALFVGPYPPLRRVRAAVVGARLAGLDGVVVEDHVQEFIPPTLWDETFSWYARAMVSPHEVYEFQTLLGNLAVRAGNLRLGVSVTEPLRRHPVVVAQAMLTLAHMTHRAPILGIGSGEQLNVARYGLSVPNPVDRLEEALQVIRLCLDSTGPLNFQGKHFRLDDARMDLLPPEGRTPLLWVAAHGPRMLRLTGRYGDGWQPVLIDSPEDYARKLGQVRSAAEEAGRDPRTIVPSLFAYLVVAPTEREARAMLDTALIRFGGLMASADVWRRHGAEHPFGARHGGYAELDPELYDRSTLDTALGCVPDEMMTDGQLLWGTPRQIAKRLRDFGDAGMRHVVLAPMSAMLSNRSWMYTPVALRAIAHQI